jgi:hypothetical protein
MQQAAFLFWGADKKSMSFGEFIGGWWSSDGGPTTPPDQSSF